MYLKKAIVTYIKPTVNIKKTECLLFLSEMRDKVRMSTFYILIHYSVGIPHHSNKSRKNIVIQIGKEKINIQDVQMTR